MLQGGALIGQGPSGCTFDTLPHCSRRARTVRNGRFSAVATTRRVAKIVRRNPANEIHTSHELMKLPGYEQYFVLIDEYCRTDDITGDPDWDKCSLLKPGRRRHPTFMQLRMKYGGIRLSEYARDIEMLLKHWVDIQIHVAQAINLLHKNGWVHGDLHFGNILIDERNVPRLVDFGLSFHLSDLKEKDVVQLTFLPKYDNYAPELDYVAGLRKGLSADEVIKTIFEKKGILEEIDELFPSQKSAQRKFEQFAALNTVAAGHETVEYILDYIRCADMWCLGFDLFSLYKLMISNNHVLRSPFYRNHHRDQMHILEGLLHPDPRHRLTSEGLLTELYTLKMEFNE